MPPNTSSPAPTAVCTSNNNGGDSPLSTTANILSILTFALGLFASYVALISATRGAPAEIKRLVDDLRTTQKEINRVAGYIFDDMHYSHPAAPGIQSSSSNQDQGPAQAMNGIEEPTTRMVVNGRSKASKKGGTTTTLPAVPAAPTYIIPGVGMRHGKQPFATNDLLYDEVQGLLKTCVTLFYEADDLLKRSERDPYGLRRRILFVMNRNEVTEKMNRLADQKAKLAAIQMSLFLRKSASHDAMLSRIAAFSETLQTGSDSNPASQRRQHSSSSEASNGENG
ncbi:hypothetical protein XANCAGTX0491_000148 [Xanthoria calcicola]